MTSAFPTENRKPKTENLVLGIDAGNTKTVALVADARGWVLGWGRGGQCNIYVSKKDSLAALDKAVLGALETAGIRADQLAISVLSAAGADWPEDFVLLRAELERRGWGERCEVVNDAVGALWAALPDINTGTVSGVMVVCGTSAGIAALNGREAPSRTSSSAEIWHSSYWQESEGADQLGEKTLRAVYRAELGIDPPTSLTGRVLAHFSASSVESVLHARTRRGGRAKPAGALARALLDEAAWGDPSALKIVCEHARSLGDYALAAARKVGLEGRYPLMVAGGLTRHPAKLLQRHLLERVLQAAPEVELLESAFEPVVGALRLALAALHPSEAGPLDWTSVHPVLEASLPHFSLFET